MVQLFLSNTQATLLPILPFTAMDTSCVWPSINSRQAVMGIAVKAIYTGGQRGFLKIYGGTRHIHALLATSTGPEELGPHEMGISRFRQIGALDTVNQRS